MNEKMRQEMDFQVSSCVVSKRLINSTDTLSQIYVNMYQRS